MTRKDLSPSATPDASGGVSNSRYVKAGARALSYICYPGSPGNRPWPKVSSGTQPIQLERSKSTARENLDKFTTTKTVCRSKVRVNASTLWLEGVSI